MNYKVRKEYAKQEFFVTIGKGPVKLDNAKVTHAQALLLAVIGMNHVLEEIKK